MLVLLLLVIALVVGSTLFLFFRYGPSLARASLSGVKWYFLGWVTIAPFLYLIQANLSSGLKATQPQR